MGAGGYSRRGLKGYKLRRRRGEEEVLCTRSILMRLRSKGL